MSPEDQDREIASMVRELVDCKRRPVLERPDTESFRLWDKPSGPPLPGLRAKRRTLSAPLT